MSIFSLGNLTGTALGIALLGCGGMYFTRWQLQGQLRSSTTYKEALQCLLDSKNAVELLGEPIRDHSVEVGDNRRYGSDGNVSWVTVPIVAKKHNANLRYWVTITDRESQNFELSKVELQIKGSDLNILLKDNSSDLKTDEDTPA